MAAEWPFPEKLYLDANSPIDAEGVLLLATAGCLPNFKHFSLCGSDLTVSSAREFLDAYSGACSVSSWGEARLSFEAQVHYD